MMNSESLLLLRPIRLKFTAFQVNLLYIIKPNPPQQFIQLKTIQSRLIIRLKLLMNYMLHLQDNIKTYTEIMRIQPQLQLQPGLQ